jgi:hypothetical protein
MAEATMAPAPLADTAAPAPLADTAIPAPRPDYATTPDRRYFVLRGRLWRLSNPSLDPQTHERLVAELLAAKRAVREAKGSTERIAARLAADAAKRALGERGEVWWSDGAPDYNRHKVANTPYAAWFDRRPG